MDSPETFSFTRTWDGKIVGPPYSLAPIEHVDISVVRAAESFDEFRHVPDVAKAKLLRTIANEIEALGPELIEVASDETWLPAARLEGERARTTNQLRMFANLIEGGGHLSRTVDIAEPERTPTPKPELRRTKIPIGPVAVFGSSNFPLAFSVAGGDTASALAAGCPVIVKAHPGHPGTSNLVAQAIHAAIEELGLPKGVFSMFQTTDDGSAFLVRHPGLEGVGFTGSRKVGRLLFDIASQRERPIPVFAEMGSVNPIFALPGALEERASQFAKGYVQSLTLGFGQFCTNPGVLVLIGDERSDSLIKDIAAELDSVGPAPMLTQAVAEGYRLGVARLAELANPLVAVQDGPALFEVSGATFIETPELSGEIFGPCGLAVLCGDLEEMNRVAVHLEGQLTATIWSSEGDDVEKLIRTLETKVGRLVFDGFPTGVEVCPSMQHGGPYPATTDSRFTSVGTAAIERWLRPICYQNIPEHLQKVWSP